MKVFKALFFSLFLSLLLTVNAYAVGDTDLYTGQTGAIKPNILIIIDTSASMLNNVDTGAHYDPAILYPPDMLHLDIVPTKVYEQRSTGNWFPLNEFKASVSLVECATARTALTGYDRGIYVGPTSATCGGGSRTLATGNWLNFWLGCGGIYGYRAKIAIARSVVRNLVATITDVRLGLMRFNDYEGGRILNNVEDLTDSHRSQLLTTIDNLGAGGSTPIAESFYEGSLYFKGADSYFNAPKKYTSPITHWCQRNYVIIMTDGMSRLDDNIVLKNNIGDKDGDLREPGMANDPHYISGGSDYLDDVAKHLYDGDLRSDLQDRQYVYTYAIGFRLNQDEPDAPLAINLLERTAQHGHGKFYDSSNTAGLANAFASVVTEIVAKTSSFVAPIVPVSRMERTTAGDRIYLALFGPKQSGVWSGNIKQYGVAQTRDPVAGIEVGDIVDRTGAKAIDGDGHFFATSRSYWGTSVQDGGEVEKGGVGQRLIDRTTARNIYTYLGANADLTHPSNGFAITNPSVTSSLLNVQDYWRSALINFVHGYDSYDDDANGDYGEKRDWILGAFLHSRPFVIHYADRTVIFAGSNDGMLHAFDDTNGDELWAFIPPDLLGRLWELHSDNPGVFVDGSPKAYIKYAADGVTVIQRILIFGQRRGGNKYYALDVTNPSAPRFAWKIDPNTMSQFAEMGQTWSSPVFGKIASGTSEMTVAFIGGGYDEGQDEINAPADDHGRAIYVVNVEDGSLIWKYSFAENSAMTYSIPSDITKVDVNGDGKIDRLYVGDMNARMWRFDIGNRNNTASWTGRIIFQSNTGAAEKRKIFYPPDVTFEKDGSGEFEMLLFGTGDREHPFDTNVSNTNRLYAFKDRNSMTIKREADLVNMTAFYDVSQTEAQADLNDVRTMSGWYIIVGESQEGEKCLATPVVFNRKVYYTTFSPTFGEITDPCFVGEGTARVYILNYGTGEAAFNLDLTNDASGTVIGRSDRSKIIGTAMPSGVIITVIGGTAAAYVGVGGGVYRPTLPDTLSLFPVHWKLVF